VGRYRTSFAYDHCTDEELDIGLRAALARLDVLTNGDTLRLRQNEQVASLNQLGEKRRASLRLATMEAIAQMREEKRRRGVIFPGN
jgi:hypothetical protein